PGGAASGGAESGGAELGGAVPGGAESARVASRSASSRRELLSPQELREWFARRWSHAAGAGGPPVTTGPGGARTGGTGAVGTGGAAAAAGVGPAGASGAAGAGAAGGVGTGVGAAGAFGAAGAGAAGGVGAGVGPAGGIAGAAGGTRAAGPAGVGAVGAGGAAGTGAATGGPGAVPLVSPLPAPSPYAGPTGGLAEHREHASRSASPVRTTRTSHRAPRPRPPASSLPALADPASDSLRAASPTVARLLSTVVTDPSFESTAASALVAELVDFAARYRLDYTTRLVAESESVCPPSVGGECALSTDVLEDKQEEFQCFAAALPHLVSTLIAPEGDPDAPDIPTPRSYAEAIEGPYSSQWQSAMDAEMASWKSTGTYVDEVPPPGANIVSGMWISRSRSVDLGSFGFFADALVTPGDLWREVRDRGSGYPLSILARYVAPGRHRPEHMAAAKRVLRYLCSTSGLGLVLGGRCPVVLTGHADASWADNQATQRSSQGYTFSLGSGSVSWRSTRSSSVLGSSCEAEIYAGAMAAQELRWLTYLLTDLGDPPHSPPVLYVDNKAMLALCREHRLEHRTKHIALRYFLARELQQRGQLRLAYVASQANTADIFTKALQPCDHQRFCTMLGGGRGSGGAGRGGAQRSSSGGGQRQQQQRSRETPSPQQLREWYTGRQRGGGAGPCTYVLRTGDRTGEQCGGLHSSQRCFGRVTGAWRHQFPDATEIPRSGDLSREGVAVFDLDYDAILAAMYALSTSDEGDCYLCVPPDPGIAATALGAGETAALGASVSAAPGTGESALSGTASAQVFHTFTLDSGASRSFFRDRTTLTPLSRPVAVSLADPSGGPILASFSTVLPCPAAPSGSLSGLYLPSFSTNLVAASSQVFAAASGSGPESAPCSCRLLSHQTLLWHHRLGHPSLPRLRGMASRVLVSGLPRSLPPLPPGPAPTCVPCVEGRQRAAPHSSKFPLTEAPLQTLHMDVWGPARVRGQGHERYFLLVVDDYSRYTTVFPLRSKGDVTEVLIDWIRAARLRLRESFGSEFPVVRLHSDRGGEFSSARLGAFCRAQGIRQTFTLPASPQKNGIAERRIGMVMDVARTSMIHAAAPHFPWPFAVQYAAHQLNLQPRVSLPETSPTLLWTGKVGDASAFRVWGSRAFVRDLFADKMSPRAVPCVFLGFPPDAPGWQFYHPTSRRVLSSQDVTFDESVPYYRLFPYRTAPLPPPPLFLAPGPPPVDPLPPQGPAPSGVSQVDAVELVEVAVDSGAATGAEPAGAGSGGTGSGGAVPGGAEPGGAVWGAGSGGVELGGGEPGSAEPGGAEPGGTGSARVASR
ncbi:unnamed protein product, partial [Closterium sp. NIES-53]